MELIVSNVPCFKALSSVNYTRARSGAAGRRKFNEVSIALYVEKEKEGIAQRRSSGGSLNRVYRGAVLF
jgi:hypothetical protein